MELSDMEPSTSRWRMRLAAIALAAVAALCLGAGIALPFVAQGVFVEKLSQILPIAPSAAAYKAWVAGELRFQVWMWNVTNAKEVLNDNAVPRLTQVGPFTFRETRTRESVRFYANKSVGYDDVRTYYFLPKESVGNMSDYNITNVNLPYFGIALHSRDQLLHMRKIIHNFFAGLKAGVFTTKTVKELLIGYQDPAISSMSTVARLFKFGHQVPTRFGILRGKNGSSKGSALVGTGSGNLNELNRIHLWNGQPTLKLWRQDWANQVVGTDGTMFPPPVTKNKPLVVFTPDLCRSVNMTYRRTKAVQGITVLAFSPDKTAMMNTSGNPHNAAFCTPRCLDSGVLNLSLCLPGAPPVVASAPHFFGAPTYASAVSGVTPMAGGDYGTQLEVEPNTGLLMRAARRMQINIALECVEGFPDTKRFGQLFLMPYLWLNESGVIGPEPAARIKQQLLGPLRLASLISWLLVSLGIALALFASVVFCLVLRLQSAAKRQQVRRQSRDQPDPNEIDEKARLDPPQKPEQLQEDAQAQKHLYKQREDMHSQRQLDKQREDMHSQRQLDKQREDAHSQRQLDKQCEDAHSQRQLDKQLYDAEKLFRILPETDIV